MVARKNKFHNFTGIEKTLVESSSIRFHFVKFEAFEVKIEITQFPIGFHITPVISFVHFLLGGGEGVLAAGE